MALEAVNGRPVRGRRGDRLREAAAGRWADRGRPERCRHESAMFRNLPATFGERYPGGMGLVNVSLTVWNSTLPWHLQGNSPYSP